MNPKNLSTCLVRIGAGSIVGYKDRRVTIRDVYLTPNGLDCPEILALITAIDGEGTVVQGTSDKFHALADVTYPAQYPSEIMTNLRRDSQ